LSKIQKILKRRKSCPTFVSREEVFSVLKRYGFKIEFKRGSHVTVRHEALVGVKNFGLDGEFTIPIYKGHWVKGIYLKRILLAIGIVEGAGNEEES